jgi:hypothetical protein
VKPGISTWSKKIGPLRGQERPSGERQQVKFNPILTAQASGSLGGNTFSHNRGGSYVRRRATPSNPNTAPQAAVRSYFAQLQAAWNATLTAAQRSAWDTYALNTPVSDALGNSINAGGKGMYTRGNVPRLQAGLARVDAGPGTFGLPDMGTVGVTSITATTKVAIVTFDSTKLWDSATTGALIMYSSRPVNPSINYFKGPYQFAGKVLGAGTPTTSPQNITTPFALTAGQKVFWRFIAVTTDGRVSADFRGASTAV